MKKIAWFVCLSTLVMMTGCGGPDISKPETAAATLLTAMAKGDKDTLNEIDHAKWEYKTDHLLDFAAQNHITGKSAKDFSIQPFDDRSVVVSYKDGSETKNFKLSFDRYSDGYYFTDLDTVNIYRQPKPARLLNDQEMLEIGRKLMMEVSSTFPYLKTDEDLTNYLNKYYAYSPSEQGDWAQYMHSYLGKLKEDNVQIEKEKVAHVPDQIDVFQYQFVNTETNVFTDGRKETDRFNNTIYIKLDPYDNRYKIKKVASSPVQ
jgi:hypothetical protein